MENTIFIKSNNLYHRVAINDINWLQSDGNYCTIHLKEKRYVVKMSLTNLKEEIANTNFVQIHQSYVANIKKIEQLNLSNNQIFIDEQCLPVGRTYKKEFLSQVNLLQ